MHHIAAFAIYQERVAEFERRARMGKALRKKERRRLSVPAVFSWKRRSHPQLEPSCGGC